jgi:beta-lactamase regulating signal transducer with metallopeptidase domain
MSFGYWFGDKLGFVEKGPLDFRYSIPDSGLPFEHRASGIERAGPIEPAPMPRPELAPAEPIPTEPVSSSAVSGTPLSWQGALFLVWLAVVIVMCLLLLQRAIFVRGLIAQAEESTGSLIDAMQYCCQQIAVKRKVSLKISPNASSPAVCGLFRPVILMPQKLASNLGSDRLQVVLMHELAHVKRADLWVNLAQTVLQIVYFYNPLLWLANAIIRRVREQAVDEAVLVAMGDAAQQYPQTLLEVAKLAFRQPALSLRLIGVVESKSALASRIKHILNRPIPKSAKLGILGLLVVILAAVILLPMAGEKIETGQGPQREMTLVLGWNGQQVRIPAPVVFPEWGRKTKEFKRWHRTKDMRTFTTYDKDGYKYVARAHGFVKLSNGQLKEDIPFVQRFRPDGELEADSTYINGEPADWRLYDEQGQKKVYVANYPGGEDRKRGVVFYGPGGAEIKKWQVSEFDVVYAEMVTDPNGRSYFSHYLKELIHSPYARTFSATLSKGVTVELIGLCEHPSEGKQWWGLDGRSIAKPYDRLDYTEHSQDSKLYEIAYRLFGSDDITFTIYSNDAVIGYAGPYSLSQRAKGLNIQSADNAYGAILLVKPDAESILLEIGAGREADWQTLCTQSSPVDKTGTAGPGVLFRPAIEKDGKTYITIAHLVKDRQIRVVAVDHLGQLHKPEGFSNTTSNELGSCQARFNLPADQIKEIQFQTQKFQRVTFKNVSLKPGVKTGLQIEFEKAAVQVEVLTDTPPVALDLDSGKLMQLDKDWPDEYDVGWDNDAGGSLFTKPDGPVKMLPIIDAKNFAEALSIATQEIESLKQRGIKGVPAEQSKYILVKTSQDNIAVVEVQEFDEGKAKIGWQIIQQAIEKTDVQIDVEKGAVQVEYEGSASRLEFRIAPDTVSIGLGPEEIDQYKKDLIGNGPWAAKQRGDEFAWLEIKSGVTLSGPLIIEECRGNKYLLLHNSEPFVMLPERGWSLQKVAAVTDEMSRPAIRVDFDTKGGELFYELTNSNIEKALAIIMDAKVVSAPTVKTAIRSSAIIAGNFTEQEVRQMVQALRNGMLPATTRAPRKAGEDGSSQGKVLDPDDFCTYALGVWNKPFNVLSQRPDDWWIAFDLDFPNKEDVWVQLSKLGFSTDADPQEVFEKAGRGDLYVSEPNKILTLRGTIMAPLKVPERKSVTEQLFGRITRMKVGEVLEQIREYRSTHALEQTLRFRVQPGEHYALLRPDGLLAAMEIYEHLWAQFVPLGFVSVHESGVQSKDRQQYPGQSSIRAVDNKATLASGLSVELLGVTYIPVTEQLWWRPDGSPLPQAPFDDVSNTPSVDPNWQQLAHYTVAIQIKGKPPQEVGLLKWDFTDAVYAGTTSAYANEKHIYYENIHAAATEFPKAVEKTTLRLGIVGGDWETIFAGSHHGFYEKGKDTVHVKTPERAGDPGSVGPDEKGLHIEVTYNITDRDFRVVAVDNDGKVHLSSRSGSGGTANLRRTTASFPDLTHDRLQEFRFQVRPYEWTEFRDISLRPRKEALALAEQQKAAKQKETEEWLGRGQIRRIRQQILVLRYSRLNHINEPCVEQTEAISAMRELVEIGQAAVPELTAELQLAEHWLEKSLIAFVLRAIGDERAVPALIEALGKSNYRGEYGIYVKDDELAKFMLDHQHRTPDESDRLFSAIIIACPVIEIAKALEKITGHSEGPDRFSPEAAEAVKQRWQNWWDRKR